ncbi:Mersacidin decarboxylase [Streptomyces roseoverticillatus]|uniref:flavoprotein n=1 Tax=Streptomyces roseoverticillatus TaxID=66429 RepID=UPI001F1746AE|nr:flavoprotein [Streptomyces roseoverticillatus]MCF3102241.1 Mersacidin decarboxylase [Streptomyces roseoverticillatus]
MITSLPCERLLLGVSGSIHAVHLPQYLVRLRREFAQEIRVIMTHTATRMISPSVVRTYLEEPVFTDLMGTDALPSPHIRLTRWAQLFVVLPATAGIMGKAAHGIADDLLSTAIVASPHPVVFAPGMNPSMWRKPAVQRNVDQLRADGHYLVPVEELTSVTTGEFDTGLGPVPETVLTHMWHVLMRRMRDDYWEEAVATPAATPAAVKSLPLLTAGRPPASAATE